MKRIDTETTSPPLTLLWFSAQWCGPCQQMAPVAERVAEMYRDQVHLVKIDVDKHPHMASEFNIRGVPTLVLTGEKQVIDRQVGAAHLPALTQWLDQHLPANTNEGS